MSSESYAVRRSGETIILDDDALLILAHANRASPDMPRLIVNRIPALEPLNEALRKAGGDTPYFECADYVCHSAPGTAKAFRWAFTEAGAMRWGKITGTIVHWGGR